MVKQPATARFLSRHLYNFFVADEPPVPSWNITPANDPAAIDALVASYNESGGEIRAMLRTLFNAEFFKAARYSRVKSPAELVIGAARLAGNYQGPRPGFNQLAFECAYQGQELLNPPSVESWHTGAEWIDGGALVRRVNFAAGLLGDTTLPGVQAIIGNLQQRGELTPAQMVASCLELAGPLEVNDATYAELLAQARQGGDVRWDTEAARADAARRAGVLLALIAASRDFQFA